MKQRHLATSQRPTREVLAAMVAQAPPAAPPPSSVPRSGTVRFTFDVPRVQHRFIKQFVLDAESTGSQATRMLWNLVQEDPQLAQRLHAALISEVPAAK